MNALHSRLLSTTYMTLALGAGVMLMPHFDATADGGAAIAFGALPIAWTMAAVQPGKIAAVQ